jgi:rhodanese-related sulfurtransferase
MKKIILMSVFSFLCSLFGCAQSTDYPFESLGVDEFEKVIADTAVVRLDVRRADEYEEGHIAGTILIDVTKDDFKEIALQKLPKDKTIVLYCRGGNRSKKAAKILTEEGYKVVELSKGYMSWKSAGKPVTKE